MNFGVGLFATIFFVRASQKRIFAAIPCSWGVNLFSAFIDVEIVANASWRQKTKMFMII
jgi:hypothetical protein